MFATVRTHVRRHIVAYVALFFALGGTAWANHESILSSDIVDGEVKTPDIANAAVGTNKLPQGAVTTGKVKDQDLTGSDVADGTLSGADVLDNSLGGADVQPLGAQDISDSAFRSDDIRDVGSIFGGKQFGLPDNAIETSEIENNQVTSADIADGTVTGSDLATSAKPTAYQHADDDTGGFGPDFPGSTEGKLTLPPGTYALFAKIETRELVAGDGRAGCRLDVAGTLLDESTSGGGGIDVLPLQTVAALSSGGDVRVRCDDSVGDSEWRGLYLKITAIQIGSIG